MRSAAAFWIAISRPLAGSRALARRPLARRPEIRRRLGLLGRARIRWFFRLPSRGSIAPQGISLGGLGFRFRFGFGNLRLRGAWCRGRLGSLPGALRSGAGRTWTLRRLGPLGTWQTAPLPQAGLLRLRGSIGCRRGLRTLRLVALEERFHPRWFLAWWRLRRAAQGLARTGLSSAGRRRTGRHGWILRIETALRGKTLNLGPALYRNQRVAIARAGRGFRRLAVIQSGNRWPVVRFRQLAQQCQQGHARENPERLCHGCFTRGNGGAGRGP